MMYCVRQSCAQVVVQTEKAREDLGWSLVHQGAAAGHEGGNVLPLAVEQRCCRLVAIVQRVEARAVAI